MLVVIWRPDMKVADHRRAERRGGGPGHLDSFGLHPQAGRLEPEAPDDEDQQQAEDEARERPTSAHWPAHDRKPPSVACDMGCLWGTRSRLSRSVTAPARKS